MNDDGFYVYILQCSDGTLYTGWTNNLQKRVDAHNRGKGAKYTRARLPITLQYWEEYSSKQEAMRREYEIKQWSRTKKLSLIQQRNHSAIDVLEHNQIKNID